MVISPVISVNTSSGSCNPALDRGLISIFEIYAAELPPFIETLQLEEETLSVSGDAPLLVLSVSISVIETLFPPPV